VDEVDAVVIGAGPNGLAGANVLADAGWDVLVLEAQPRPGGAVKTTALTEPGFLHDEFSAFYPLGAASPVFRQLELERWGVRWRRAPLVVAHPATDGSCAVLSQDAEETAASLERFAPGDGAAWRRLSAWWERVGPPLIAALLRPFPPVRPAVGLLRALGGADGALDFLRFALLPVRRHAEEEFRGAGAARLLAGNALHADLNPDSVAGALYAWVLCGLGQGVGWPAPEGGAGAITDALVRRLRAAGGELACGRRVDAVLVRGGRAAGVRTADGREVRVRRAVLADVGAPALYRDLLAGAELPRRHLRALERFQYDTATVKVDWALDAPIPWTHHDVRRAGTVHVTEGLDALSEVASELNRRVLPRRPFLLLGQYAALDPTRQPPGRETAWAYTHVPQGVGAWDEADTAAFVARMEDEVEALAPGFRALVRARHVHTPRTLEAADANLVGGAVNGGTAQLHQQVVFRPVPGWARPETPVPGLFLASASAHPGGGVHGACGANAARAAVLHARLARRPGLGSRGG
jgi:phytoene dehydrogenase-like protein